jgi:SAM-dependent methyltransferase
MTLSPGQTVREKDSRPNRGYLAFHRPRFAMVIDILRRSTETRPRVLDVGRSPLTTMIHEELGVPVDSLGLEPDDELPTGRHFSFDLNDAQFRDRWRTGLGPYDAVVFAEVIEHLYTAPELVLDYVRELLVPGGLLVVQTPNAASLGKRVKLACGTNPFERIRADRLNPGHYREYTLGELVELMGRGGFDVERTYRRYYFDARFARHERGDEAPRRIGGFVRNVVYRLLPPQLREGMTVVARRGRA